MPTNPPLVIVWGNCQADPLATLLGPPLEAAGWRVVHVPPVFEIDEAGLSYVQREVLPHAAALIAQPVRDEYRIPGCGTGQLAGRLSDQARVVRIPNTFDTSAFPYQVNAHRGDGSRVDAPQTDYHDLRALVAAERGMSLADALDWWPTPSVDMVTKNAASSRAELERRELDLDVATSDLLTGPAMFTMSHPTNTTLVAVADRILDVLDLLDLPPVEVPEREFLGARRAPVEQAVVNALGWSAEAAREDWVVDKRSVPLRDVLELHLRFYGERPDIAGDARVRFADRLALLNL